MPQDIFQKVLRSLIAEDRETAEAQIHEYFVSKTRAALSEASPAKVVTIKVKIPHQFFELGQKAKAEFLDVVAEKADEIRVSGKPKVSGDNFVFDTKGANLSVEEVKTVQADLSSEIEDSFSEFLAEKASEIVDRILPKIRELTGLKALKKKTLTGFILGGGSSASEDEALGAALEEIGYTGDTYAVDKAFFTKIGVSKEDHQLLVAASM